MELTNKEYSRMTDLASPPSRSLRNCIYAFITGGAICTLAQIINMIYSFYISDTELASTATSMTMIFLGAFFTGLNLYDNLAKYAGAGTLVPITGFANSIAAPAIEYRTEGFIMGVGANMFKIAGPVLVYGISASVAYGIICLFLR